MAPNDDQLRFGDTIPAFDLDAYTDRDVALARVALGNAEWIEQQGMPAIRAICQQGPATFTTDEVWDRVDRQPREPRAMGAAIMRAKRAGLIRRATDLPHRNSRRDACNNRPLAVWRVVV